QRPNILDEKLHGQTPADFIAMRGRLKELLWGTDAAPYSSLSVADYTFGATTPIVAGTPYAMKEIVVTMPQTAGAITAKSLYIRMAAGADSLMVFALGHDEGYRVVPGASYPHFPAGVAAYAASVAA